MRQGQMSSSEAHYNKMVNTPVQKLVLQLAVPTIISMMITTLYSMADTYFVGKLGNSASGAIGVVFGLMSIIQAIGFMYGHGAGSIVARRLGQKDSEAACGYASVSFYLSLATGAVFAIVGLLLITPLMRVLGSTTTILPYAKDYGKFVLLATPLYMGSFVLNNILRYEGKASIAMIGLTIGGVLNIAMDPICIFALDMGIAGAAMAIVNRICFFVFAVGLGIGQGFQPVSAFNYGAKRYERVKKAFYFTWSMGEAAIGCLIVVCFILSGNLIGIFRNDERVIEIGIVALRYNLLGLLLQPGIVTISMLFQSIGENKYSAFVAMLRSGLCFIPVLVIFRVAFGLFGVQIAQPVADLLTFFITIPIGIKYVQTMIDNEKKISLP